jgi:hypothetical protein
MYFYPLGSNLYMYIYIYIYIIYIFAYIFIQFIYLYKYMNYLFRRMKGKNCQSRISYSAKISFKVKVK